MTEGDRSPSARSPARVLVIVAHADDMEFFAGGTVANMVAKGMEVHQIITTNNEKGSFTIPKEAMIRTSREEEAKKASDFLGLKETIFFEYPDGELDRFSAWELKEKYMRAIRRIKPDILMTWDPFAPYEPHPDHRRVGLCACEAAEFAHMPAYFPEHKEEGLLPHYVSEYYYFAKYPWNSNKFVDISETLERKIEALLLHKSQMELTVMDAAYGFRAAGMDPGTLGITEPLSQEAIKNVVSMGVRKMAQDAGKKAGCLYAEEFRHKGYGMAGMIFPELVAKRSKI